MTKIFTMFLPYRAKFILEKSFPSMLNTEHDDVIKWKHFPRYWPFVRGIHRSPVNSPHKGQWRVALMFYLICARINRWVNDGEVGDLRRHRAQWDVAVMDGAGIWNPSPCKTGTRLSYTVSIQLNLSVTTTFVITCITCDLFSNVF